MNQGNGKDPLRKLDKKHEWHTAEGQYEEEPWNKEVVLKDDVNEKHTSHDPLMPGEVFCARRKPEIAEDGEERQLGGRECNQRKCSFAQKAAETDERNAEGGPTEDEKLRVNI